MLRKSLAVPLFERLYLTGQNWAKSSASRLPPMWFAGIDPMSLRTNCDIRLDRSVEALSLKLKTSRGAPLSSRRLLAR